MELRFCRSTLFLFLGLLSMLAGVNLFAQDAEPGNVNQNSSEYTTLVRTYNIRKIYSHRLGYRIDVLDYRGDVRSIYAKNSWFVNPDQRDPESDIFEVSANMNYLPVSFGLPSNFLTVKYVGGKLQALVIYVVEANYSRNGIWSQVSPRENIDSKFEVETLVFTDRPAPPTPGPAPAPVKSNIGTETVRAETVEQN